MGIRAYIEGDDLDELSTKFRRFDQGTEQAVDDATKQTVREFRDELTSRIREKGLVGRGDNKGDGPPLHSDEAWSIQKNKNGRYMLRSVHDRAYYLEFGTRPYVAGDASGIMKFRNQNGNIVFAGTPDNPHPGIEPQGFWRESIREFEARDRFENNLSREINRLMEETF